MLPSIKQVPIEQLRAPPWGTRTIREERLANLIASLDLDPELLQLRPVLADREGIVYAGWQCVRAALALGWTHVPAVIEDVPEGLAQARHLRDNNHWGEYREHSLAELLTHLDEESVDLDCLGFEARELEQLLALLAPDGLPEPELVAAADAPITQPGDTWELGPHRVHCGDARSREGLAQLFGDQRASLLATDPPYGVHYEGKTADRLTIANDGPDALAALLRDAFEACDAVLAPGAACYVAHPAGPLARVFLEAFVSQGWDLRQTLVWVKDQFVLGHSDYHYQHEPILFGYTAAPERCGRGAAGWYGDDAASSVFAIPRPQASPDHPTTKPVALIAAWIRNSSRRGAIVLDPFLGSGTTLLAAEETGRVCYGCELEPRYVDVAVRRWEALTAGAAIRRPAPESKAEPVRSARSTNAQGES